LTILAALGFLLPPFGFIHATSASIPCDVPAKPVVARFHCFLSCDLTSQFRAI